MLAELWYRHLMSVVDDYGRYYANPAILRTATFPCRLGEVTEQDVAGWLKECVEQGLITIYDDGNTLVLHKFGQRYRSRSKFCPPPDSELSADCPQPDSGLSAGCQTQTETETKTKTESNAGEKRRSPGASSPTHSSPPSLSEVLAYGEKGGIPEATCVKLFHHFNGKARGWKNIVRQHRLDGWHELDLACAAEKQQRPRCKPIVADCMLFLSPDRSAGRPTGHPAARWRGF
jgi:hypothetical protein